MAVVEVEEVSEENHEKKKKKKKSKSRSPKVKKDVPGWHNDFVVATPPTTKFRAKTKNIDKSQ